MKTHILPSALTISRAIDAGKTDPRALVEELADRISTTDPGHRIFYRVTLARARWEADAARARAQSGLRRSPLDGVPLSWKDLIDTAGVETPAGSRMLSGRTPRRDAAALARMAMAGTICIGKTAMTELAFSGLGINPVCGTPANAHDTKVERVPGGSSSGAGVSLARGLCAASIGTDTGGSVRIPAAWNGLVGFKPSHGIIPTTGVVPLCPSLDTIGPLTRDVADAAALFEVMAGRRTIALEDETLRGRSVVVPANGVLDDMAPDIARAFEAAINALTRADLKVTQMPVEEISAANRLTWESGVSLAAVEAWAIWEDTIKKSGDLMYSPVRERFESGAVPMGARVWQMLRGREALRHSLVATLAGVDALAMPTIPIDPPPLAELERGGPAYDKANRLALRNTTLGNQLDMCAITLPIGTSDAGLPVGLMLMAPKGRDARLLRLARSVEKALA